MIVQELFDKLKSQLERDNVHGDFANLEIVVMTSDPSIGPRAHTQVKYANRGIDWEHGMFCLVTEDKLVKTGVTLTQERAIYQQELKNLTKPSNP